ncbi:flavin-containing monooxygenase [Amycolatopsis nigrescens]|uniref:flavin-containing monooxygenase n=1 Tax=Amycolatopsis nigrescens TaxID=381445 RepID=UPI00036433DF|nr:NAD(P)/FAD-dependent oxidoreductase [Amycolatopsis nigrescens]
MSSPSILIAGSGFGGIAVAIELKRAGFHQFTLLEKAAEIGGVWRENTYPGAACDVPSPYYSLSYEPNPAWPTRYSLQADIHAYMKHVVEKYDLARHIRFGAEVVGAAFERETASWRVRTADGAEHVANVFVPALGQLSRPVRPDIPGRETFAGPAFHSAEWAHGCELAGKRVAVIGTGASAIQFVPKIQPEVARLTLFQRAAPYVVPKPDREYSGWQRRLFRALPPAQSLERLLFWSAGELSVFGLNGNKKVAGLIGWIARKHLDRQVADPALRAKLTPDYPIGCKRVLFANDYYPAVTQSNVDVQTGAIAEITPGGVRTADDIEHPADVLVYGTGFAATDFLGGLDVRGLDGRELKDAWAGGARAYLGLTVPGFPNLFCVYGPNTNLGSGSIIYMIERQASYIRQAVEHLSATAPSYLDVRAEVERDYDEEIQGRLAHSVWTLCSSWYRQANGRVPTNWPGTVSEYDRRTKILALTDYRTVTVPGVAKAALR